MEGAQSKKPLRPALDLALIGIATFALSYISGVLREFDHTSAFWPANAVIVAALLKSDRRRWPALIGVGYIAMVLAHLLSPPFPWDAKPFLQGDFGLPFCNAVDIVLCAVGMRWVLGPNIDLTRGRHVSVFLLICGVLAPLISAILATAILSLPLVGAWSEVNHPSSNFITYFGSRALGLIVLTPVLLEVTPNSLRALLAKHGLARLAAPYGLLAVVLAAIFAQHRIPLQFLALPVVMLITFQLGLAGGALAVLVTACVSVVLSSLGLGPAARMVGGLSDRILVVQLYMTMMTTTVLFMASMLAQQARLAAASRDSEARYRLLADKVTDVILQYDLRGRIQFVTPSVAQLGFKPEDMIGRRTGEFVHPDEFPIRQAAIQGLIEGGAAPQDKLVEYRALRADGAYVWMESNPSRITNDKGEVIGVVTILRDVTARRAMDEALEQKRAEAELAERATRLAAQIAGISRWRVDLRTGENLWSDNVLASLGLTEPPVLPDGEPPSNVFHPDDRQTVFEAFTRLRDTGEPFDIQVRLIHHLTGEQRILQFQGEAERDADGVICAMTGVDRDVTEEVIARRKLEESEARFRRLAESATDTVLETSPDGIMTYVSPSILALSGYSPQELIGRPTLELVHPDDRATVTAAAELWAATVTGPARAQATTMPGAGVFRLLRKDGRVRWMESRPTPISDPVTGALVAFADIIRDITERKALEDELRRKQVEAEVAAVAKAEFLANMSHEIRTPLTGVLGFAGLMERLDGLPAQAETYIKRITSGGQALLAIVNDVLDFSRLEAGRIELDPQPFDLRLFLDDTLELMGESARKKGLDLALVRTDDLPEVVSADMGRLRQVLLNLLSNAVKFTETGGVTLTVRRDPSADDRLRFEVTDTGMGIAADHADRLFQRFSQVDGSNTRQYGGAGLGLAISKGLTDIMGGEIGVDSLPGRGSTFWFTVTAPAVEQTFEPGVADTQDWGLSPLKILVVDDLAVNRELILAILQPFDLDVTEASSGLEAVDLALQTAFDLILMDLQMPGMDGLAATQAIRANSDLNRATPILAISANVMPAQVEACRKAGMNDHIGKPINPAELLGKIALWSEPQQQQVSA
jgi:PAS domain S-box-containing protein